MYTKLLAIALLVSLSAEGQTFSEKIYRELSYEKQSAANALIISNIFGNIHVVSHTGPGIVVEVSKSVNAKTAARLEEGKAEVQLGIIDRADTIILYVKDGCHQFERQKQGRNSSGWSKMGWGYQSQNRDCNLTYDYKMDFTVKVPVEKGH